VSEPADLVRSVSRALRLLEEAGRSERPLPVKALARRTQLNLSTTYHLVRTLAYEGYLVRTPDGCYVIGAEVARRYHDLLHALGGAPEARPVLAHVAETTGHSAYLGRFVEGRMLITDLVEGPASPYLEDLEVGLPCAAHATAAGKALLATLPRQTRRDYLAEQGMRPFTSRTATDTGRLDADLADVGPGRVVVEHGEFRDGVSCAAALVGRDDPAEPWWTVVVSARAPSVPPAVQQSLLQAASDLTTGPVGAGAATGGRRRAAASSTAR
jgi:DNA-binding IclR family transcriptional regulator